MSGRSVTSKPNLLFLSHRLPWPPHNGAAIRTYNILKLLADRFDVTLLCFDRRDPALSRYSIEERMEALRELGCIEVFPIPQEESRARLVWDHARSLLTGRAYVHYVHDSRQYLDSVRRSLQSTPRTLSTWTAWTWSACSPNWTAFRSSSRITTWSPA